MSSSRVFRLQLTLLALLGDRSLRNEIEPRRSAEENIKTAELKTLLELFKLQLRADESNVREATVYDTKVRVGSIDARNTFLCCRRSRSCNICA